MDGHGAAVGGAIVDSGNFDWMAHADKFPGLCTPDESYHGITYAEKFGQAGAFITKCTAQLMRDLGSIQSPQHAFYLNLGLESLHVRMPRHVENGQAVAEFLANHPKVVHVTYSGLPEDKYYELAQKYLPDGSCGVVSFGVKGGRAAAEGSPRPRPLPAQADPGIRPLRWSRPCALPPPAAVQALPAADLRRSRQRSCSSGIPPQAMVCTAGAAVIAFPVWM